MVIKFETINLKIGLKFYHFIKNNENKIKYLIYTIFINAIADIRIFLKKYTLKFKFSK